MRKIKWILAAIILFGLIYTRFVSLDWGFPYPFHPDERNMASALQGLSCDDFLSTNCFNPHFLAYGQFSLYLGYFLLQVYHFIINSTNVQITFSEATMVLRVVSAVASVINVYVLFLIVQLLTSRNSSRIASLARTVKSYSSSEGAVATESRSESGDFWSREDFIVMILLLFIFSPGLIQFAHFGTTESLLMLFYSLIVYLSLKLIKNKSSHKTKVLILQLGIVSGLAIGTKISSLLFILLPVIGVFLQKPSRIFNVAKLMALTLIVGIISSPYNIIDFSGFINSMRYESAVATGSVQVFYTRQFIDLLPVFFQFLKIFPYALGIPVLLLFILGFIFLPRKKEINLLRIAFLVYFLTNAFFYTKWTRFMAPVFPLMIVFAVLFLYKIKQKSKYLFFIVLVVSVIPGVAYLSVYQQPDVRFTASEWIYKHIPENAKILSETANVVDIPIQSQRPKLKSQNYRIISFNFYELDRDINLQQDLKILTQQADYIFVPSRRLFMNHSKNNYPILNDYYKKLFSGELGFKEVAQFSSYPKIGLFGKTLIEFPDEAAEETWSVFDHPVIRIYKRT